MVVVEGVIEEIHRSAAIQPVLPSQIDWQTPPGAPAPVPVVRGLEDALDQALSLCCSLHETGFAVEAGAAP